MKLAVIFPGIGYHTDKPLLYYSKKIAMKYGYEIKDVYYSKFPADLKKSKENMHQAYLSAFEQTEKLLKDFDFSQYNEIIFISKSIGTAVAVSYANKHELRVKHILYTPVEATFLVMASQKESVISSEEGSLECIAFHGTCDPWVETDLVINACSEKRIPLYITENANHSLETGDTLLDISNLKKIMMQSEQFMI